MSLLTLAEARDQCRLEPDYPNAQLQPYVDAAEEAAFAYLNCAVFVDAATLATAQDAVPAAMATAGRAYAAALDAAAAIVDDDQRAAASQLADVRFMVATQSAMRTIHGIVANPAIMAAVRLTLGHLFANREDVLTGIRAVAVNVPQGAQDLLRPYRRVMTP